MTHYGNTSLGKGTGSTHYNQFGVRTAGNLALCSKQPVAARPQQSQQPRKRRMPVVRFKTLARAIVMMSVIIAVCGSVLLTGLHHWALSSRAESAERTAYAYHWNDESTDKFEEAQDAVREFGKTNWIAGISVWLGANAFTKLIRMAIYGTAVFGLYFSIFGIGTNVSRRILAVLNGKAKIKF